MKNQLLILPIVLGLQVSGYSQTNTFPSSGNVGIGTTSPGANLSFDDLNDGRNTADGITWYSPGALDYGIYRTPGAWASPNYQQLKLNWETGIVLNPGSAYGRSYVDIQGGGLRVSSGNVGIGTTSPAGKLDINHAGGQLRLSGGTVPAGVWTSAGDILYLADWNTGSKGLNINLTSGKLGIGTTTLTEKLTVSGGGIAMDADQPIRGDGKWLLSGNGGAVTVGTADTGVNLRLMAGDADPRLFVSGATGSIGIGTQTPGTYKLAVEGKIGAREVNVTTTAWSDYVFNSDYKLRPLSEVQQFIADNHHLPEVPSEKEVLTNGQNLGEMNATLLKKIEELTLYLIEMKDENRDLRKRIEKIENEKQNR